MFCWTAILFVRGVRSASMPPELPFGGSDGYLWVFLVPALNEEVTIRDSVERLISLPLRERRVLVINDGSEDRTGEILREMKHPDLFVLKREKPEAQKGKAAGLNNAYRALEG